MLYARIECAFNLFKLHVLYLEIIRVANIIQTYRKTNYNNIMHITSLRNPQTKHIIKLRDNKKQRQRDQLMLVEGRDEINLALASGYRPQMLFTAPELTSRQIGDTRTEIITVNRAVFEKISYRENPDGWLGIFPIPKVSLDDLKIKNLALIDRCRID